MKIIPVSGGTDQSLYFVLRDSTTHQPKTDMLVTGLTIFWVGYRGSYGSAAIASELTNADDPHADNQAKHVGEGLYRIDFPDTPWSGSAADEIITVGVKGTGIDTVFYDTQIGVAVNNRAEISADVWESAFDSDSYGLMLNTVYAGVNALPGSIWDALTASLATAGSIGKLLVDNVNAAITSRSSHSAADVWAAGTRTLSSYGTLAADIATAVWEKATSALTTAGSIGKLLIDNVNATISSRSSHSAADVASAVWGAGARTLTSFGTLAADAATAVWEKATSALTTAGSIGKLLVDNVNATISSRSSHAPADVQSGLATAEGQSTAQAVLDKLNDTVEADGPVYRFTQNALEQAPSGGSAPTADQVADAVWNEGLAAHNVAGSAGEALAAAGTAGNPWLEELGAYADGTAGFAMQILEAWIRNLRSHDAATGELKIYASDGVTVLATLRLQAQISVTGADWTNGTLRLSQTDAFKGYAWKSGDTIDISAGTGVTAGQYTIAAKIDADTIELAASITGGADVADASVVATITPGRDMVGPA